MQAAEMDSRIYDPYVRSFGEAVLNEDWQAAYAMTTPAFQADYSMQQMQESYQELVSGIREHEPDYKPNRVRVDRGSLPSSEDEAKKYGVRTVPPQSTWRSWSCASIGHGDEYMECGVDAWMLVVEESGSPRIAHVEFMFGD